MTTSTLSDTDFDHIYLAFDIHDVLAEQKADTTSAPLFQAYGMLLQVPVEGYTRPIRHYIYPFVKELFQLLAATSGVHIAFATSSKAIFAKPFVKQLLIQALGQEEYVKIADKVHICANEQLRDNSSYKEVRRSRHSTAGNQRKDLDDIYSFYDFPSKQRLLIDNDASYAAPHQIKNLLNVSGGFWSKELEKYQRYGYCLYFTLCQKQFEEMQSKIEEGSIVVYAKQVKDGQNACPTFVIVYHKEEGKEELELNLEESVKIKELYDRSILESQVYISEKYPHTQAGKDIVDELKKTNLENPSESSNNRLIFVFGEGANPKKCIATASHEDVAIHLSKNDANIYLPQNGGKAISLKEHGSLKLLNLVREHWKTKCQNEKYAHFFKEKDKEDAKAQLYDVIWDKVKDLVWKEKLIHAANHILLVTGAIFSAWEESKVTQKPFSKILFNWQCKREGEGRKQFTLGGLEKRSDLYLKGLELLRKVNPNVQPITIKSFESALKKYPSLPEDGAKEHEDNCIIS